MWTYHGTDRTRKQHRASLSPGSSACALRARLNLFYFPCVSLLLIFFPFCFFPCFFQCSLYVRICDIYVPWITSSCYFVASDTAWYAAALRYRSLAYWCCGAHINWFSSIETIFCSLLCDQGLDLMCDHNNNHVARNAVHIVCRGKRKVASNKYVTATNFFRQTT